MKVVVALLFAVSLTGCFYMETAPPGHGALLFNPDCMNVCEKPDA